MVRSKLGLRMLGLCAVVLGTMAFASAAQAEPNAFWLVSGAKLTETLKPSVEGTTDVEETFLTELGGKFIHIKCKTVLISGHFSWKPPFFLITITLHGCVFYELTTPGGTLKEVKACQPRVGATLGDIQTNKINGLIKLHEGKAQIEVVPAEAGKPFATIQLGEECAFGEKITFDGVFWLNDSASETNQVTHLMSELKSLTKLTINGGAKTATIDGSVNVFLGGAHKGLTFSARPG